jgi:hypothetical protein
VIAELTLAASLATAAGAYVLHRRGSVVQPTPLQPSPAEPDIEVDVLMDRKVGEVLMYPFGPHVCFHDCYAVIVLEDVSGGFYRVRTFHENPKELVLHTSQLYTKSEIESRSRLVIGA